MASAFDDALKNAKGTHFLICPWRRQTFSEDFQNPQRHSTLSTFVPKGFFFNVRRSTTSRSSISRRRVRIRPRSGDCRRPMVVGFTRFISKPQPTTRHPTSRRRIRVRVLRDRLGPQRRRFNIRSEVRRFEVRSKVPIRIRSDHHRRRRNFRHYEPHPATTSLPRSRSRALRHLSAKSTTSMNSHPGSSPPNIRFFVQRLDPLRRTFIFDHDRD